MGPRRRQLSGTLSRFQTTLYNETMLTNTIRFSTLHHPSNLYGACSIGKIESSSIYLLNGLVLDVCPSQGNPIILGTRRIKLIVSKVASYIIWILLRVRITPNNFMMIQRVQQESKMVFYYACQMCFTQQES